MSAWALYGLMAQATLASFTGLGSLPLLREALVTRAALLTDAHLAGAVSLSYATPGPNGAYIVTLGYWLGGVTGAAVSWLALITPAALVLPLRAALERGRDSARVRGAAAGVSIAGAALMLQTATTWAVHLSDARQWMLLAGCGALLATARVAPVWVVLAAAAAGALLLG